MKRPLIFLQKYCQLCSWFTSLHIKCFILNTSVYKTSQLPSNNPHMPQKLPEIPSNNISIQSGVELYKEIRASFLEAKRFLLLFCSRYNAFSVYKVLLTKSFGGFFLFNRRYSLLSFGGPQLYNSEAMPFNYDSVCCYDYIELAEKL